MGAIKPTSYRSLRRQRIWVGYLCILPAMLGFFIFTLAPLLYSLYLSFTDWSVLKKASWVGVDNYVHIFTQDLFFVKSLKATAYYSFGSVIASIVFCLIVALVLNMDIKGRAFFRAVFYLPSVIPILATAVIFLWLFDVDFGVVNYILSWFGIDKQPWFSSPKTSVPTLILMTVWGSGNIIIIFLAGLQDIPKHLLEAVEIDGGSWWSKFRSVTVPLLSPVIFYNVILSFVTSITSFTQAFAVGGPNGGGVEDSALFYAFFIYREAFRHQNMGYACALAMVLFAIVSLLTYLLFKYSAGFIHYEGGKK